ncbi:MAG: hypothetical protein UW78_C0018G0007 [Candidatus Azambacteria bacterium GW2011_GWA1_44_9]|nr:MAG: hypothetical protein UW78_C0018G0007 [Candidatus Azambacteria bacterium GW2011_GWA1_44_9]
MKLIIGILVASIALIGGAVLVMGKGASTPKRENQGSASMTIDKKIEDFGSMKSDEEKTATFTIANTSDSTLRLWNISTSCDCTFATVTIGSQTTGEFNMPMHMKSDLKNWIGEVPAKQTAVLNVMYRPKVMPVVGAVTRQVTFSTNDPNNPQVEVSIAANVL